MNKNESARSADFLSAPSGSGPAFPDEPFVCPHCGQMLAPECRVCVACRQTIDPAEIKPQTIEAAPRTRRTRSPADRVYFPWSLFIALLIARLLIVATAARAWGITKAEVLVGALEILTSAWVFYDAPRRHIAKPFRWGIGSLLLWAVFFPWYIVRRRAPETPCPFMEAESGQPARTLLFVLFLLLFLGAILLTMQKLPK
jgi:hypothetical protein